MLSFLFARWTGLVATGQLFVVCGVLVGSLTYQFALGELPCPLCVIQRLAFLLACVGPIGVLLRPAEGRSDWGQQARGFGMTIPAALVGSAASIRQILLHIVPPDLGYGPPVHLSSWALVVFGCLIASSAIGLCGIQDEPVSLPRIPVYLLCSSALVIGLTVAFATFFMQGFNALLPPDPTQYELWHTFPR